MIVENNRSDFKSLAFTLGFFILLEILSTTLFGSINLLYFKVDFNVAFILFFSFFLNTNLIALNILILQIIHSAFNIEGWAIGCVFGVLLSIFIDFIRDWIILRSYFAVFVYSLCFHFLWYLFMSLFLSMKVESVHVVQNVFLPNLFKSFLLAIFSVYIFKLLFKIWGRKDFTSEVFSEC